MNETEAQELYKEQNIEWKRLPRIGETIYGIYDGFRPDAGQYADEQIKNNPKYEEWQKAEDFLSSLWNKDYAEYCQRNPPKVTGDAVTNIISAFGHAMVYDIDRRFMKTLIKMKEKLINP